MIQIGLFLITLFLMSTASVSSEYPLPPKDQSLIGEIIYSSAAWHETATSISHRYDVGYNAIEKANPHLQLAQTQNLPSGVPLTVPSQHLLPDLPRIGIIVNLPEMRMYYFVRGTNKVLTYPIGIGKSGKNIPITETYITEKKINPSWRPPDDIREFNLEQGIVLPKVMPAGPDNPLGPYAIYMKLPTYLIHSTIFPESIGKRASFGCIRMYESDIHTFFPSIESGTKVAIINSPVKLGWQKDRLYMEAFVELEEQDTNKSSSLSNMIHTVTAFSLNKPVLIDWQMVAYLEKERDGIPHEIGIRIP